MLELFKKALHFVVTIGSSTIVNGIAVQATKNSSTVEKVVAQVAGMAIGGLIGEAAAEYMDEQIDNISDGVKKLGIGDGE
jgi:uncharacterized membrane protein YqgA involved in biofilm formation